MTATSITATTIAPGERIHHWTIISVNGRQATARCRYHQVRIVTIEDLLSGVRTSCGCAPPAREHRQAFNDARQEQSRRRDFGWRRER
jgi:hypothetical protein